MKKQENGDSSERFHVVLRGLKDLMFDRYSGMKDTDFNEKLYLNNKKEVCIPQSALFSLFTATNTESAPKVYLPVKEYKKAALAYRGCLDFLSPELIPLQRGDQPIVFTAIPEGAQSDPGSGVYVHRAVARVTGGIPNDKVRPTLPAPWKLSFDIVLEENDVVSVEDFHRLLRKAGKGIGLGTYRPRFGKFEVETFEEVV